MRQLRAEVQTRIQDRDEAELCREAGFTAERFKKGTNLVLLEPDVAAAFPDEAAVNEALRLVMRLSAIPTVST